jgi:hypothetical protein
MAHCTAQQQVTGWSTQVRGATAPYNHRNVPICHQPRPALIWLRSWCTSAIVSSPERGELRSLESPQQRLRLTQLPAGTLARHGAGPSAPTSHCQRVLGPMAKSVHRRAVHGTSKPCTVSSNLVPAHSDRRCVYTPVQTDLMRTGALVCSQEANRGMRFATGGFKGSHAHDYCSGNLEGLLAQVEAVLRSMSKAEPCPRESRILWSKVGRRGRTTRWRQRQHTQ